VVIQFIEQAGGHTKTILALKVLWQWL